ncbi:MAG: general stress protein CsbD [Planctomycetaceae bacterium]|nr:general stress protein CsbD [Planctomycetaceae bacterium]
MATQEQINGKWNEVKGYVRERWGEVSNDELAQCEGDVEQLIGLLQQKTGETRERIENAIGEWLEHSKSMFSGASATAQDVAGRAYDAAKDQLSYAGNVVKRRPAESIVVAFGTGILVGAIVGLLSNRRS